MRIRSTVTALSAALALAVVLTTSSTPAFAAKSKQEPPQPTTTVEPPANKPKIKIDERPKPGSGNGSHTPTFKPDLRVTYVDFSWDGDGKDYHFRVENIGIETAYDIGMSASIGQRSNTLTSAKHISVDFGSLPPLATGQSQMVTVPCSPPQGYHCTGASLGVSVDDDLDPSNNGAGSD